MAKHQHLYNTQHWKRRRRLQRLHHPTCAMCAKDGVIAAAQVSDHISPHHGDPNLFFAGRLQSLCKRHHDVTKQRAERSRRTWSADVGADGTPLDPTHPFNAARR